MQCRVVCTTKRGSVVHERCVLLMPATRCSTSFMKGAEKGDSVAGRVMGPTQQLGFDPVEMGR